MTAKTTKVDYRRMMKEMTDAQLVSLLNYVEYAILEAKPVIKALRDEILRRNEAFCRSKKGRE